MKIKMVVITIFIITLFCIWTFILRRQHDPLRTQSGMVCMEKSREAIQAIKNEVILYVDKHGYKPEAWSEVDIHRILNELKAKRGKEYFLCIEKGWHLHIRLDSRAWEGKPGDEGMLVGYLTMEESYSTKAVLFTIDNRYEEVDLKEMQKRTVGQAYWHGE